MAESKAVASPVAAANAGKVVASLPGSRRYNAYLIAVMLVACAFALRYWLYGGLNNRLPFAFFLPATMIAAWYGGLGPGLLAATAGLLLGDFFFLPPHQALGPLGEVEKTSVGVFAVTATLAVFLIGNLQNRVRDLEFEVSKRAAVERAATSGMADAGRDAVK